MFRYPSLPAGVDQINIHAEVKNPGGAIDLTTVNIQPFSFRLAGNPFSLTADVKHLSAIRISVQKQKECSIWV